MCSCSVLNSYIKKWQKFKRSTDGKLYGLSLLAQKVDSKKKKNSEAGSFSKRRMCVVNRKKVQKRNRIKKMNSAMNEKSRHFSSVMKARKVACMCLRQSYSMHNCEYVYLNFKYIASASKNVLNQMRHDYRWMSTELLKKHDIRFSLIF